MAPLARLPVFYALNGRKAVVAGGTAAAAWKAELLAAAGANVVVMAPDLSDDMLAVAAERRDAICIVRRRWQPADLAQAAMAVADCEDAHEAARFATAARAAGVPVNVIDKPDFCDFAFGSIVNRSPLVIGVSTDGAAPVFAQAVRAKIEAMIPRGFAQWAEAARRWRKAIQSSDLAFAARRRFWQEFTARAIANPDRAPSEEDYRKLMAVTRAQADAAARGSVTLVGAGPGDPELLTLRAVRALQSADAILFDDLVSAGILDFARREARRILVGKTGHGPSCRQDEINALMISLACKGRRVVRLKGGDPMIFGRAGEEIDACRAAGIAVECVPGITAAQGAASRLAVSLTRRAKARRVQYVSGHREGGAALTDDDCRALADPQTTTAVYMPMRTLAAFTRRAIAAGLDPATPALAIARATWPDERIVRSTVQALPALLAQEPPAGPVLVMIGTVFGDLTAAGARSERRRRAAVATAGY